jgi:hypothetical protein
VIWVSERSQLAHNLVFMDVKGQNYETADISAEVMVQLFPELRFSTDIVFMEPSKKAARRIQSADPMPDPLDRDMWAHERLNDLIRGNVAEVAGLGLRRLPMLTSQRQVHEEMPSRFDRRSRFVGMMRARGISEESDLRLVAMRELLSAEPPTKKEKPVYPGVGFWENKNGETKSHPGEQFWEGDK